MRSDAAFLIQTPRIGGFYALRGGLCVATLAPQWTALTQRFYALRGGLCVATSLFITALVTGETLSFYAFRGGLCVATVVQTWGV